MNDLDSLLTQFRDWSSSELLLQFFYFILLTVFILFVIWQVRKGISRTVSDNAVRYRARKVTRVAGY